MLLFASVACGSRSQVRVDGGTRRETRRVLTQFERYRLRPASIPPPTVERKVRLSRTDGISGSAELVLAEDAEWNAWPGATLRLFNNRAAHLFHVDLSSDAPVRWLPERTFLELNEEGNLYRAAATPDALLEDLVFWAYHQERSVLEGDLAQRLRAAGPLRDAYLEPGPDGLLEGIVAFPLETTTENEAFLKGLDPSDFHVVSMRLTLGLEDLDGERRQLVWVFE